MAKKNKQKTFKEYECCNFDNRDNYLLITKSMMLNDNYISLNSSSKILYHYMKLWSCGNEQFKYSYKLACIVIGSRTTVYRSINELEKKGFIEIVSKSKQVGYSSIFKFSNKWYKNN